MAFFLVRYCYTDDTAGRDAHRARHKDYLSEAAERGMILGSGPFAADEEAGAAMIYRASCKADVVEVVEGDPFRCRGYVASYEVTEWIPMIGPWAADAQRRAATPA
ncbi:dehydrogenase [Rhodococcus rhodnii]|uniref:Dehydrogenase n=2 Tax=Rhodococcus rhodnii TaxID=38312 RepID=R7WNT9_9NOCA|nr:YciI family protein [Rhodococcus rhodnii]EOM76930.1 dehydrogenase [Rhodococcus rhodnii LMG 5362]TXG89815.1 dehydrogenase [Rhodococcus rhodnii]